MKGKKASAPKGGSVPHAGRVVRGTLTPGVADRTPSSGQPTSNRPATMRRHSGGK